MKRQKQDSRNTLQRLSKHLLLSLTFILVLLNSASALVHPGGWLTQDELTLIRDKVAAQEEPWYSAWKDMENKGADTNYSASVASTITNQGIFQADGHAAYVLAIKWVASGNQAYANTAKDILNAWANTVTGFNHGNTPLRQGIAANKMANAAEIIAWGFNGGAGWSTSDINNSKTWFIDVVYPVTSTGDSRSMNWGTSCLAGNMSMAIFCDNNTMFDDAVDAYKFGFTNTNDGCAGVTQYIINSDGQCFESERDQGHAQGGIAHLVEAALVAWNQNEDLVSYSNDRLVAGMEYSAKYNLGNNVSFTNNVPNPCNLSFGWMNNGFISAEDRGDFSPIYVLASSLFTRAGKSHPYTAQVITDTGDPNDDDFNGYDQPESDNSDHPGLGTLTHSTGRIVTMRKRNSNSYGIDGGNGGSNGQNVYLWSQNSSNVNQQWIEIDRGNGYYSYQKNGTQFCLDGGNGGGNGQNVYLWTCSSSNQNQHWDKISSGSYFRLQKRNSSSYSIDGGNGGSNGQNLYLWTSSSSNQNQQWQFSDLTGARLLQEDLEENLEVELKNSELTVYPNPVSTSLTVLNPESIYDQYSIYNMGGKTIHQNQIASDVTELSIDLKKLNGGVYILELKGETAVKKVKLLKN